MIHGLEAPHPERSIAALRSEWRRAPKLIRKHAEVIASLSPRSAGAEVRRVVRSVIDVERLREIGGGLESTTRRRFEAAIAARLNSAMADGRRDGRRRDMSRDRSTTITIGVGQRGALEVVVPSSTATVREWARDAAELVRDVADDVAEGIAEDVAAALEAGMSPAELAAKWRREGLPLGDGGRLESRLALVADNQLARLNAELGRERARAAGLGSFEWVTMGDSRVRPRHRELAGTIHAYTDPPDEGLPGQPPRCRCHARTVVTDDDVDRLLGLA